MLKKVDKELKGSMFQQNENDKEKNYKKKLNRYSGALKYITNKKSSTWFNSKFDQAEDRINKFEDRTIEIIQAEEQKENKMKRGKKPKGHVGHDQVDQQISFRNPRRQNYAERIFEEIMTKNFSTLRNT